MVGVTQDRLRIGTPSGSPSDSSTLGGRSRSKSAVKEPLENAAVRADFLSGRGSPLLNAKMCEYST